MCHAVPAQVTAVLPDDMAQVDLSGAKKTVSTALVGPVTLDDFLLVHVGYALGRVDPEEAQATLAALQEIGAAQ